MKVILCFIFFSFSIISFSQWDTLKFGGNTQFLDLEKGFNNTLYLIDPYALIKYENNNLDTILFSQNYSFRELSVVNDSVMYLVNFPNYLLKSSNSGQTWDTINNTLISNFPRTDLYFQNDSVGWFTWMHDGAGTIKTVDGGLNWDTIFFDQVNNIHLGAAKIFSFDNNIYQVGSGYFLYSLDNGVSWGVTDISPNYGTFNSGDVKDSIILITGQGFTSQNIGLIGISNNYGLNWTVIEFPDIYKFEDIVIIDDSTYIAVGASQGSDYFNIYKTIDRGITWLPQGYSYSLPNYPYLTNIACINEDICLVCGYNSFIAITTNGGGPMLGISEIKPVSNDNITVYPNPSMDYITVMSEKFINEISLYDYKGALVKQQNAKDFQTQIDISVLAKGFYLLKINTNDGIVIKKIEKL